MSRTRAVIVYCSPAGTTRHVAGVIAGRCREEGAEVTEVDLGRRPDLDALLSSIREDPDGLCLFIGSPVYASRALPALMDLIARLPGGSGIPAVPFVTWGGACSGIALHEMGEALCQKGLVLAGAAKVLAVHSMMWRSDDPLGGGHPDVEDDRLVEALAFRVLDGMRRGELLPLSPDDLALYPEEARAEMAKVTLTKVASKMPVREVDEAACTECGDCAELCPAEAIALTPYPQFGESCILCFTCVRECPEDAIRSDLTALDEMIRKRAETFAERPWSQVF